MDEPIFRSQSYQELKGLSVVIPCYKEDPEFLTQTYQELTQKGAEVLIVDDGGNIDLPIHVPSISYKPNLGYGYAIKRGITEATQPLVCTMDGDLQHQVIDVIRLYRVFNTRDDLAMVVGVRWNIKDSFLRWICRKCINFVASLISGHYQQDLNSGMRIFRTDLAIGYKPILCDTFSFTTSLTMAMTTDGHKITYFPIDVIPRKYGKSRVRLFKDGFTTLYYVIWIGIAMRTRKIRQVFRTCFSFYR